MSKELTAISPILQKVMAEAQKAAEGSERAEKPAELSDYYQQLKNIVEKKFPALWPLLHGCLAATASLCFSNLELPITLIASGPPSSGKTQPLMWLMRSNHEAFFRSDNFTPKAFVSHAANVKKETLQEIDLLPKLQNKCFCTKELAPLFSGREDELKSVFAQLTTILDGEGLISSSGSHGTRGYNERIVFTWLGATTPLSNQMFNIMAALGTRLFFFSTHGKRPTPSDYATMLSSTDSSESENAECREAVGAFLGQLLSSIPVRSLPLESIAVSQESVNEIALLCYALTLLRGGLSLAEGTGGGDDEDEERYAPAVIEHGWRASKVLLALAKSSALVRGSNVVGQEDVAFIRHVCLSSMPEGRRFTFETILKFNGQVTAADVAAASGMAKKTAHHHLKELKALGVVTMEKLYSVHRYTIHDDLRGLLPIINTPTDPVTPVTQSGGVCAQAAEIFGAKIIKEGGCDE